MRKLIIFINLVLCVFSLYGQNFSADMANVNNRYINLNKNMVVSTETSINNQTVTTQEISMSIKSVEEFYMKDSRTEVLVRDGLKILVSQKDKAVIIDSNYQENLNKLPISLFDTLKNAYESIERTILENGNIQYKLVPKTVNSEIMIVLEKESLLIKMVKIESKQSPAKVQSLTLTYAYKPLSILPSISDYIVRNNGTYQLNQHWAGFTLLNYLPQSN